MTTALISAMCDDVDQKMLLLRVPNLHASCSFHMGGCDGRL